MSNEIEHKNEHEAEEHGQAHHITSPWLLLGIYLTLVVFMFLTVAVVYYPLPSSFANNAINLGIALVKASLVVLFFMGVKYGTKLIKTWAYAGFIWLTLAGIIFGDYMTRDWQPAKGWYSHDTEWSAPVSVNSSPLVRQSSDTEVKPGGEGQPKAAAQQ